MKAAGQSVGEQAAPVPVGEAFYRRYEEALAPFYEVEGVVREPIDYLQLEQRLGPDVLVDRLQRQLDYVEGFLGNGLGLLRYGPLVEKLNLITLSLRASMMLSRGLRNAAQLRVEENDIAVMGLPDVFDGYRILQLADLHFECNLALTEVLVEAIRELDYDLCVITGDYRYRTYGPHEASMAELQKVVAGLQAPAYGVLGNHDAIEMVPACEAMGLTMLVNEGLPIARHGDVFFLAGLEDDHYYRGADFDRALRERTHEDLVTVLLSHSTEVYSTAIDRAIDVIFSGHTHGGQICLPGGISVLNAARSPRKMVSGAWEHRGLQGYTSRGSGCVSAPVRFNCPPEVTLHTLRAKSA